MQQNFQGNLLDQIEKLNTHYANEEAFLIGCFFLKYN